MAPAMSNPKLVFLGFDSMDIELISAWAEDGLLPHFKAQLGAALAVAVERLRNLRQRD
jgi:hypothetical protein